MTNSRVAFRKVVLISHDWNVVVHDIGPLSRDDQGRSHSAMTPAHKIALPNLACRSGAILTGWGRWGILRDLTLVSNDRFQKDISTSH